MILCSIRRSTCCTSSIPPPAELPPFGTWWRLHVVPLAYSQKCRHKLQQDVTHLAISMIDYIPPEIHPLNGQMRGFAGLIEVRSIHFSSICFVTHSLEYGSPRLMSRF